MATIADLVTYPVKGCAGVRLSQATLTDAGLEHDREFMVTDPDGTFRSQRYSPRLAVIRPFVGEHGVTLSAPDTESVTVPIRHGEARPVRMFDRPYRAVDQGDIAAAWLSEVLGEPSRLVRVPPDHGRVTDGLTPGTSGFADSCAILLLSLASVDELGERIGGRGGVPVSLDRFRANVIVTGWSTPHREDHARRVSLGDAELGFAKLAIRCAVTLVDQTTGEKAGPEPLRTLADYRRDPDGGVAFGAKFAVLRTGRVRVGHQLVVSEWDDTVGTSDPD